MSKEMQNERMNGMKDQIEKNSGKIKTCFLVLMLCIGFAACKQSVFANADAATGQLPPGPEITAEYIVEDNKAYILVNCVSWPRGYAYEGTYREYEISTDGVNFNKEGEDGGFIHDYQKIPIGDCSGMQRTYYILKLPTRF